MMVSDELGEGAMKTPQDMLVTSGGVTHPMNIEPIRIFIANYVNVCVL